MEKYDVQFKKKFGQNFLKDIRVVKSIVETCPITSNSLVIEVGPGGAIMTRELALKARNVLAYEIDSDLEDELYKRLEGITNVDILFQDFLLSDLVEDVSHYSYDSLFFISNVPYYITTPIILKLIKSQLFIDKIVLMVQKEVGERFNARPGNREYGSITVLLNYFYDIKKEFYVSRKQFIPEPNVDSVIVSFTPKNRLRKVKNISFFEDVVRDSFQFKRKTIKNNLIKYDLKIIERVLESYGFDLSVRAEMLDVEVFVDIANALRK